MPVYYSTFASGLQEPVSQALRLALGDARIELVLDGLIVYATAKPIQKIRQLRFLNNTFLLLGQFSPPQAGGGHDFLAWMMAQVLRNPDAIALPAEVLQGARFYRITASRKNQTTPIERDLLARLERLFNAKLGLRVHRTLPDVEVWFLERSEGVGFVGLRLSRRATTEKDLQRGELKPELTSILCLLSEPDKKDVFLDPFAGSGAIPLERARGFAARQILAGDADRDAVRALRRRAAQANAKIVVEEMDAVSLRGLADGAVDKIVTDPPWGLFEAQNPPALAVLYARMLREFERVLRPGGLAVILMGQKELFEGAISQTGFEQLNKYDILVSGKKAAIYKLRKKH